MQIKIWGTRGSTPVAAPRFSRYGGDTVCIEVRSDAGDAILLDAGSGLGAFARESGSAAQKPTICLTHAHLDHIQGLPFYAPMYDAKNYPTIYGPEFSENSSLRADLARLFDGVLSPPRLDDLPATDIRGLRPGQSFYAGSLHVETAATNHPGCALAYKITGDGWTFAYTGDHEIPLDQSDPVKNAVNAELLNFLAGADVVMVDCQYDRADHLARPGWGHSHFEQWLPALNGVKYLIPIHFSPDYDDARIDELIRDARARASGPIIIPARPGLVIGADGVPIEPRESGECRNCDFFRRIGSLSDTHAVFSALLSEARERAGCDAGSVYIVENGELIFSAAQNDTLFPDSAASKFAYMNARLPIDRRSLAGYAAIEGKTLNIGDVYAIDASAPYIFNDSFDKKTGYRTRASLSAPLVNSRGSVIGVLQLINPQSGGRPIQFSPETERDVAELCSLATAPIERSLLLTDMIVRTLRTAALRDPNETAGHVRRVGAMAAELYHRWGIEHGVDPEELLAEKGKLRLASMLHDVGKVGIPDKILKKPGRLDDDERFLMQEHAALGAGLFEDTFNEIELMAREIALHHHARWDGKGYTGSSEISSPAGENIPLSARVTAIADVYDALVSKRCYKDSWDPARAAKILREEAGKHFDPELVRIFLGMEDLVRAIFEKYE